MREATDTGTVVWRHDQHGDPHRLRGRLRAFYEATSAGRRSLVNRGAKANNPKKPTDGVSGPDGRGPAVEIVGYGCSDDTADKAIEEARRLVEQDGADILIGPLSGDEGIAVANYAQEHPERRS